MEKLAIIYNPVSGGGCGRTTFEKLAETLMERNIDFTEYASAEQGAPERLARQAMIDGAKKILALGGDGTVREVAQAVAGTDAILCVIPCGSGNDLVRTLNIPTDPVAALDIALNGKLHLMDAGKANGKWFFNVGGCGFDVDVLINEKKFHGIAKNGSVAYYLALLKSILRLNLRESVITWPEGSIRSKMLIVAAGNGAYFGGGMCICPGADPFDGKLDCCIIHGVRWYNIPFILPKFLSGKHIADKKHVLYFRTTEIAIDCSPSSEIELDGEIMPGSPVKFEIVPKAIRVMAGER